MIELNLYLFIGIIVGALIIGTFLGISIYKNGFIGTIQKAILEAEEHYKNCSNKSKDKLQFAVDLLCTRYLVFRFLIKNRVIVNAINELVSWAKEAQTVKVIVKPAKKKATKKKVA